MVNSNFFSFYCKKFFQYNNNEITCFINYNSIFTLFNAIFLLSLFSEIKIENKHSKFYWNNNTTFFFCLFDSNYLIFGTVKKNFLK